MFTLRCTRALLARLKPDAMDRADTTTKLGDWYCTLLDVRPGPLVLRMSEKTFLCTVIPLDYFRMRPDVIVDCVSLQLRRLGVPPSLIDAEAREMGEFRYGSTNSRVILGCMNDAIRIARVVFPEAGSIEAIEDALAQNIYRANKYIPPIDAVHAAFGMVQ